MKWVCGLECSYFFNFAFNSDWLMFLVIMKMHEKNYVLSFINLYLSNEFLCRRIKIFSIKNRRPFRIFRQSFCPISEKYKFIEIIYYNIYLQSFTFTYIQNSNKKIRNTLVWYLLFNGQEVHRRAGTAHCQERPSVRILWAYHKLFLRYDDRVDERPPESAICPYIALTHKHFGLRCFTKSSSNIVL